jgi:hypothetical protein
VASAVRSRLGPNHDVQNTIEARRRAERVDNHHNNHWRRHNDSGRGRRHDSDDDRDPCWSPNQRGPRAFGQRIRDAKSPSRFRASTIVPRYNGGTNPSVWLEDYRLACHTGGATDDLFVIKNLPQTWLEYLRGTRSTTGPTYVGSSSEISKAPTCAPASSGSCATASSSRGESLREYIRCFSKCCTELLGVTDNNTILAFQNGMTCTSLIQ